MIAQSYSVLIANPVEQQDGRPKGGVENGRAPVATFMPLYWFIPLPKGAMPVSEFMQTTLNRAFIGIIKTSGIEHLTTDQKVSGSTPDGCATSSEISDPQISSVNTSWNSGRSFSLHPGSPVTFPPEKGVGPGLVPYSQVPTKLRLTKTTKDL